MNDHNRSALSKMEQTKLSSEHLRGTIAKTLESPATHFEQADSQLLKFHGIYQQDDRDKRLANRAAGLEKAWSMMIRLNIPGGRLKPEQYLELDRLADSHANGSLRLTTRQSIQFHGVLKGDLKSLIESVNTKLLTTLGACGDVERNVMACAAPINDEPHRFIRELAGRITAELMPATGAYFEIWIDGERALTSDQEEEPFYGEGYFPRKFKTGIALDSDNSVDVYAYDCGLVGITERGSLVGFNLLVGGGCGMTHRKPDTIVRLASPIAFIPPDRAVDAVRAVATVFRDHGNRSDRRHARLKYLIEEWGVERFKGEVQRAYTAPFDPPRAIPDLRQPDYLGRHDQGDGRQFYGVFVANGRVVDRDGLMMRSALREIVETFSPSVHLTPMQSILFGGLHPTDVDQLIKILRAHHVPTDQELTNTHRYSMACPALPTCGLALAESERIAPEILGAISDELEQLGLAKVELTVRITGCPNGCTRPYNADIGIVGRKPGVYHVYVGGGLSGDRLADLYAEDVPLEEIVAKLGPLLKRFRDERQTDEGFGCFYQRLIGRAEPRALLNGSESPTMELVQVNVR